MATDQGPIEVRVSPEAERLLGALARHGLFGESIEEVASALLREKLREVVLQGWLGPPGWPSGDTQPLVK